MLYFPLAFHLQVCHTNNTNHMPYNAELQEQIQNSRTQTEELNTIKLDNFSEKTENTLKIEGHLKTAKSGIPDIQSSMARKIKDQQIRKDTKDQKHSRKGLEKVSGEHHFSSRFPDFEQKLIQAATVSIKHSIIRLYFLMLRRNRGEMLERLKIIFMCESLTISY